MIVARGEAEKMAFWACVQHGNHNNAMLFDQSNVRYQLAMLQSRIAIMIDEAARDVRKAISNG